MCPVVVVRLESPNPGAPRSDKMRRRREAGRVVVGVGGSSPSASTLEFGFRAAAQRGVALTALVARPPDVVGDVLDEVAPANSGESMSWPHLITTIARLRLAFPSVSATTVCRPGSAADVLVEESDGAALLVVGQRDRTVFGRRLFGSVTHSVLNRASCPVAIVRR
jgi:nucleotide-binding universal stress UspA family protein